MDKGEDMYKKYRGEGFREGIEKVGLVHAAEPKQAPEGAARARAFTQHSHCQCAAKDAQYSDSRVSALHHIQRGPISEFANANGIRPVQADALSNCIGQSTDSAEPRR